MSEETKSEIPKKNVYKYFNGVKEVYADPFELDWRMQNAVKMTPNIDTIDSWLSPQEDVEGKFDRQQIALLNDAYHFYIPKIVDVFGLKKFDPDTGEGMVGEDIIDLWSDYLGWRTELKKNTESEPISVKNSDSASDGSTKD
jgi:hypothetical protein